MKQTAGQKINCEISAIQKNSKDVMAVKSVNFSCHGLLKYLLQYIHHYLYFKKHGDNEREKLMLDIIFSTMRHIEKLENLMLSLGVNPVFIKSARSGDCIYKASFKHTAEKMLVDDVAAKLIIVRLLKTTAKKVFSDRVREVIYSIAAEEERQLKELENSFKKLRGENCVKLVGLSV